MTAARARSSQRIRSNSDRATERLEGFQPVVEDWHAKVCFLGVSMIVASPVHNKASFIYTFFT